MTYRQFIWLAALWQFIYIVDFVLPLPLGPLLSRDLGFALQDVAWLSVSYTAASLVSGLLAAQLVEQVGRRAIIRMGLIGFVLANVAAAFAESLPTLATCRALAAASGAPVVATLMAYVIDQAPPQQRGRSISAVMSGASMAVIAGVPLALFSAETAGWRSSFLGLAALGGLVSCALWRTEVARSDVGRVQAPTSAVAHIAPWRQLMSHYTVRRAYALQALSQLSTFLLIPILSGYMVSNLGVATNQLPWLYGLGGLLSFVSMRASGRVVDQFGHRLPVRVTGVLLMLTMGALAWPGLADLPLALAVAMFVLFMAANAAKNVALSSYTAGLAPAELRASFMNAQGSVQDLAVLMASLGPVCLLSQTAVEGLVIGMPVLAATAIVVVAVLIALSELEMRRGLVASLPEDPSPR